jgi:hypothetical protein
MQAGRQLTTLAVVALLALALAAVAQAEPWDGGPSVRSNVEQKLYETGATFSSSGGRWEYYCADPTSWGTLGAQLGFDTNNTWGFVQFAYPNIAWLSPQACKAIERVMNGRIGSKACQTGETPVFTDDVEARAYWTTERKRVPGWKRISVVKNGKRQQVMKPVVRWKTVRVQRWRDVPVRVQIGTEPVYAPCSDWELVLFGAQTASHETFHMLAQHDEGVTECYGMQNLAYWVWKLSGDDVFAKEAAADYWAWYQAHRPGTGYGNPGCYPGGALDLDPTNPEWPTFIGSTSA